MREGQPNEHDVEAEAADAERFLRELRLAGAARGSIVKMIAIQAGWVPGHTLNVSGDELSAMVIQMRRGELEEEADEQSGTEG